MITLGNVNLINLLPMFLRSDPYVVAFCSVMDPMFHELDASIQKNVVLGQIQNLENDELDILAKDLNCTWYDTSDSLAVKRNVLENAVAVHQLKGTTAAVEMVAQNIFGDARVDEWHSYSGTPGHYRIVTSNAAANGAMADRFIARISAVARKTARLDQIIVELASELKTYIGFVTHIGGDISLRQVT